MDAIALKNAKLPDAALKALAELIDRDDPGIIGIILTGSAARGMATENSDVDVMVIRDEEYKSGGREVLHSQFIDEIPKTLTQIETVKPIDSEGAWERWSFAWALVLRDSTGGRVAEAVRRQATLDDEEIRRLAIDLERLGEFLNYTYRALKSHRDGRRDAARLDSAECVRPMLDLVFGLCGRVRPYNKYLAWELEEHPLPSAEWPEGRLLACVSGLLDGEEAAIRVAFRAIELQCLAYDERLGRDDLAAAFNDWGSQLDLHRQE